MWTDPIVEETRRIRDEHAKKFNYDLRAIFEDIKQFEESLATSRFPSDPKKTPGRLKKDRNKTKARRSHPKVEHCAI